MSAASRHPIATTLLLGLALTACDPTRRNVTGIVGEEIPVAGRYDGRIIAEYVHPALDRRAQRAIAMRLLRPGVEGAFTGTITVDNAAAGNVAGRVQALGSRGVVVTIASLGTPSATRPAWTSVIAPIFPQCDWATAEVTLPMEGTLALETMAVLGRVSVVCTEGQGSAAVEGVAHIAVHLAALRDTRDDTP